MWKVREQGRKKVAFAILKCLKVEQSHGGGDRNGRTGRNLLVTNNVLGEHEKKYGDRRHRR